MRTTATLPRRVAAFVGAGLLSLGFALVVTEQPAAAATVASGNCTPYSGGPMCYLFRSSYGGSAAALNFNVNDEYAYTFSNKGLNGGTNTDGYGSPVANHAGSGWNRDSTCIAQIWEHTLNNPGGRGLLLELNWYGYVGANNATLGLLNNNNRSQSWRC